MADPAPTPILTRIDLRGVTSDVRHHLPSPKLRGSGPVDVVAAILAEVRSGGDTALRSITERFDRAGTAVMRTVEASGALPPGTYSPARSTGWRSSRTTTPSRS
jgi:hypothetical protein